MSWGSLILTGLQLVLTILKWTQQRQLINAGHDKAVAAAALEVLDNTKAGKEIRERIKKLDDPAADQLWDDMINA